MPGCKKVGELAGFFNYNLMRLYHGHFHAFIEQRKSIEIPTIITIID